MTDDLTPRERIQKEAERRRRMAEIFGDVIPDQTSDETADAGDGTDRRTEETAQEDWLKSQVPPHHG